MCFLRLCIRRDALHARTQQLEETTHLVTSTPLQSTINQVAISVCGGARSSLNLAMSYTAVQNTSFCSTKR